MNGSDFEKYCFCVFFFCKALLKTQLWQMIVGVTMDAFAIMVVCTLVKIDIIQVRQYLDVKSLYYNYKVWLYGPRSGNQLIF